MYMYIDGCGIISGGVVRPTGCTWLLGGFRVAYLWVVSRASRIFPYAHARAKVGGGREGKIRLGTPARFSWLQLKILS